MNCKPGQMCKVVKPAVDELLGAIVTTGKLLYAYDGSSVVPVWTIDRVLSFKCSICDCIHSADRLEDVMLRPLFGPDEPDVTVTDKELEHVE